MLRSGQVELTPSFSPAFTTAGNGGHVSNTLGLQLMAGTGARVDLGFGYARTEPVVVPNADPAHIFGFGAKISLAPDRVALLLPLSTMTGGGSTISKSWRVDPTVVFTVPAGGTVDVNPSFGVLLPLCDLCGSTFVRLNLGVGVHAGGHITVRPEFGMIFHPGDTVYWSLGAGVSIK